MIYRSSESNSVALATRNMIVRCLIGHVSQVFLYKDFVMKNIAELKHLSSPFRGKTQMASGA